MMAAESVNIDEVMTTPEPRRASLERLRAVGQTFTDGIAALRDRVISGPIREHSQSPTDEEGSQIGNGEEKMSSSEVTFDEARTQRESPPIATPELVSSLRSQVESLQSALDRTSRLLTSSRTQSDKFRQKLAEESGRANAAFADVARLRTQIVDVEHEMRNLNQRVDVAERGFVEEQKKSAALERVCISLRRRAAIAETHAEDAKKMREAVVAREIAETSLAECRAEAEKWGIKSTATDVLRERAEAAERSERTLREKVDTLERELESRESLLRQNIVERRKLKEYMTKYERELEEKERRIVKLKRTMKKPPPMRSRRVRMNTRDFGDIDDHRAMSTDETEFESTASQTHRNASIDADETVSFDYQNEAILFLNEHCNYFESLTCMKASSFR